MKKRLSRAEEFDILKLVLDKFLWLGIVIMGFGLFRFFLKQGTVAYNLVIILSGAIVLVLFLYILVKEYEILK